MVNKRTTNHKQSTRGRQHKEEIINNTGSSQKVPTAVAGIVMIILTNYQTEIKKIFEIVLKAIS